jgi:3-(3-hydroxy-phenyl)propionate hydroxylase
MYDILIVGCGPVGAILANFLGKDGISVAIIDELKEPYEKPRAINIDQEVLRTCALLELAEAVQEGTVPHTGTDFLGSQDQLITILNSLAPPFPLGWPPNLMFLQPKMEAILWSALKRIPSVDLRTGHRLIDFSEIDGGVRANIKKVESGESVEIEARYLVACDGGGSGIRKNLGITQSSLNFDQSYVVVDALIHPGAKVPKRTTHYCRPSGPGTYIVGPGNLRRFEMKVLPNETLQSFEDVANVRAKLSSFVDVDTVDIWRSAPYRFHALVADQWRVGKVFFAGDAAHQMPPHLGQGLCSGIRDAANLSWKLKLVLGGLCDESLFDSYQAERRPHIDALVFRSKQIAELTGELDPVRAAERDRRLHAEMESGRAVTERQRMIPGLTLGILDPAGSALSGELAVQPRIVVRPNATPVLLDEIVGERFALLSVDDDPREHLSAETCKSLESVGTQFAVISNDTSKAPQSDVYFEQGRIFNNWMAQNGARFIIVRPDKYVYGTAAGSTSVEGLAVSLCRALNVSVAGAESRQASRQPKLQSNKKFVTAPQ